jgi:hypothetical protein
LPGTDLDLDRLKPGLEPTVAFAHAAGSFRSWPETWPGCSISFSPSSTGDLRAGSSAGDFRAGPGPWGARLLAESPSAIN